MNGRERLQALMTGKPLDRPMVAPVLSLYGAGLTDCSLEAYYSDPGLYVEGQRAVMYELEPDILFGPFSMPGYGLPFDSRLNWRTDRPPNIKRPGLNNVTELDAFTPTEVFEHAGWRYFREANARLVERFGDRSAIAFIGLSPVDLPVMMMGIEAWLVTVLTDPEGMNRVLDFTMPLVTDLLNEAFGNGVSFAVLPAVFVSPTILTKEIVAEQMMPILRAFLSGLDGPVVLHSGGARMVPFLDLFRDLPNVAGFVINPGEDPVDARARVGDGFVIDGNLDGPALADYSATEIHDQCTELLASVSDDPLFILGTSAADIPLDTPIRNIQAMKQAASGGGA